MLPPHFHAFAQGWRPEDFDGMAATNLKKFLGDGYQSAMFAVVSGAMIFNPYAPWWAEESPVAQ